MLRKSHVVIGVVASVALMALLMADAAAAVRGGGLRVGGPRGGGHFGRLQRPYSYGGFYDPYGYGYGVGQGVPSVYYSGGSITTSEVAPMPPPALSCRHSQEIVTVPMSDGSGTQQVRITRC